MIIQYENGYKLFLEEKGVGSNDKVADSIKSYISYLNSISRHLDIVISPDTLSFKEDCEALAQKLTYIGTLSKKTITNYKSAMYQYINMIEQNDFNRWNTRDWDEVLLKFKPSGKAPKKYGDNVYKFSAPLTLGMILPRRGWDMIKATKNYIYLKPPADMLKPPFEIKIRIPSKKQAMVIAQICFDAEESWGGQVGEWPAIYVHKRELMCNQITSSKANGGTPIVTPLTPFDPKSSLYIGEHGIWGVEVEKTNDEAFTYYEYIDSKNITNKCSGKSTLLEGKGREGNRCPSYKI